MADQYPVTERTDVLPAPLPAHKEKYGQTSHDEAMNPPNNPKKDKQPTSYNVTDDYCTYGDEGNKA